MTIHDAAPEQPTRLPDLLKARLPFLRRDTLQRVPDVVEALIQAQSTCHRRLGTFLPSDVSPEARKKRLQRCFQDQQLTGEVFLDVLLPLLPPGKLVFTMDRTNWEHGTQPLNLRVLGVVLQGFTLPLVWEAIPHSGSSNTSTRERLVARLLKHLPAARWKVLVADREFLGRQWFEFLRRRRIKRCIRVKGSARVDGDRLDEVYAGLSAGQMVAMAEKEAIYGCRMQLVMARSPEGDLMCLATDLHVLDAVSTYKFRWSIECTFSSMKSRGFNLEQTGMTQKERLERLFGLVTLAWTWSLRVGVDGALTRPIRVKSHGRKEASLVTAGWERLAHALRWGTSKRGPFTDLFSSPFSAPEAA